MKNCFQLTRSLIIGAPVLAFIVAFLAFARVTDAQAQTLNIADAVAQGAIEVELKGTGELFFMDGLAYTIRNRRNAALTIVVPVGQVFEPDDSGVQPLVVAKEYRLALAANGTATGRFTTFCASASKSAPDTTDTFRVGQAASGNLKKVADAINRQNAQGRLAGQFAVWAVTDNFTLDSLELPEGQNEIMQFIRPFLALARDEIKLTQTILDDSGTGIKFYTGELPDKVEIPGVPNVPGVPSLPDLGPLQRALDFLRCCGCAPGVALLFLFVLRRA